MSKDRDTTNQTMDPTLARNLDKSMDESIDETMDRSMDQHMDHPTNTNRDEPGASPRDSDDLSTLGEFGIVDLFRAKAGDLPAGLGIGDDCAVLDQGGPQRLLVTTDMLVEDIHFLRTAISPWRLGWKSMAVNVSDVAAMAGKPLAAFLSLGLPQDYPRSELEEFRDGLLACCREYDLVLAGGDTVSSPQGLLVNVAVVGSAPEDRIRYRSGARPGQIVCTAGPLGASAAGLDYLLSPPQDQERIRKAIDQTVLSQALAAHLEPRPQVDLGLLLGDNRAVGAVIDLSDGLVADLGHIAEESRVRLSLDSNLVPLADSAQALARAMDRPAMQWALFGGEEYCLLFTLDEEAFDGLAQTARDDLGIPITAVGRVESGPPQVLVDGRPVSGKTGWDHFSHA